MVSRMKGDMSTTTLLEGGWPVEDQITLRFRMTENEWIAACGLNRAHSPLIKWAEIISFALLCLVFLGMFLIHGDQVVSLLETIGTVIVARSRPLLPLDPSMCRQHLGPAVTWVADSRERDRVPFDGPVVDSFEPDQVACI